MKKLRLGILNIHELPNLFDLGIHNYALDLLINGDVKVLYFDVSSRLFSKYFFIRLFNFIKKYYLKDRKNFVWNEIKFVYNISELNSQCDVLLNFNSHLGKSQFTKNLNKFNGVKVYHVNDYFWNRPGSDLNKLMINSGVDFLMGYAQHDKFCSYFQKTFPTYINKTISVPFGFSERFLTLKRFSDRKNKCVALGSVNPLRPNDVDETNYIESAGHFNDEIWFHKFRRQIVEQRNSIEFQIDSLLPIYPVYKDFKYDLVQKFNEYKMFVSCESIFNFPPAKYFEGPASGTVLFCSDHECNKVLGFESEINCVMYEKNSLDDLIEKIKYFMEKPSELETIQRAGTKFVIENYSHKQIAKKLFLDIQSYTS